MFGTNGPSVVTVLTVSLTNIREHGQACPVASSGFVGYSYLKDVDYNVSFHDLFLLPP